MAEGAEEEGEVVGVVPAADDAPGEGAAVMAAEPEVVEVGEDGILADEDAFFVGEGGDEERVERAEALRSDQGVAGAFAGDGAPAARHGTKLV